MESKSEVSDKASKSTIERYSDYVRVERDAAVMYRGLAGLSRGTRRAAFLELADIEDKHVSFWEDKIRAGGQEPPAAGQFKPSERTTGLLHTARQYSVDMVLPIIEMDERDGMADYADDPDAPEFMIREEEEHARVLGQMLVTDSEEGEGWHRNNKSGSLRAAIFGVNDGLISNTALVMGFAGATAGRETVLFAGVAGLLAGAFSMAAGEFISMSNQRESFEREIELEALEIELMPEEEQRELELIYIAKGVDPEDAKRLAEQVMKDKDVALDTMVREELGLDPDELGSPWGAASSSFIAFAIGAVLVVLPYIFVGGTVALITGVSIALLALIVVGGGMAKLNGRPMLPSILRQVAVGVVAAGATFFFGAMIGLS